MNPLRFAQLLGGLRDHLEWAARHDHGPYANRCEVAPLGASYLYLLNRLAGIERPGRQVLAAVTEAVGVFDAESARADQARQQELERAAAEYAEAVARHEAAVMVGCSYCDAVPGAVCRTASGQPRGVHDHAGRIKVARFLSRDGQGAPP